jgi:hypothetical protein
MRATLVVILFLFVSSVLSTTFDSSSFLLTPRGGWRHQSCVHGPIPEEHVVIDYKTHSVIKEKETGRIVRVVPPCTIKAKDTANLFAPKSPLPSGWVAYAYAQTSAKSFSSYNGSWSVPPVPADKGAQTLFFFTGLQNSYDSDVTNIIQPVLQFGPSAAGGGAYYALASWYVDSFDNAYFSKLLQTTTGNAILGTMVETSAKDEACCNWAINSIDSTSGKNTLLTIETNTTEPFSFVTLEVYTVSNCKEYPTGSDTFSGLSFDPAFTPNWTPETTPGCQESVTVNSPTSITIDF